MTITTISSDEWHRMPYEDQNRFNGIIMDDHVVNYMERGRNHRDLGPARIYPNGGEIYYLYGWVYEYRAYWTKMLEKYRGTEHEGLYLSMLMGSP